MKINKIFKKFLALVVLMVFASSCTGYDGNLMDTLIVSRVFSPIGLTAVVKNKTTVELNWTPKSDASYYVVDISANDATFATIYKTLKVNASELPIQVALEGQTLYSIRVKGVSATGVPDSKWSIITAKTLPEQIILPSVSGDIQSNSVIVRWPANSTVTSLVVNPGAISRVITAQEKINGYATITGLVGDTNYTVSLNSGTNVRGTLVFTSLIDLSTGTVVNPTDNLSTVIANAADGALLLLQPGDYTAYSGPIALSKSITIRGIFATNKPLLRVNFSILSGAANVKLRDLDLNGGGTLTDAIRFSSASTNYNSLAIIGCNIHDFTTTFIGGNIASSKVASVVVDNSVVTNINMTTSGGDFIDFRLTYVASVSLTNSTFVNCCTGRDFVRIDNAGFTGTGLNSDVLIDSCTLYNVSNIASGNKRILYVRFATNTSKVSNTLIAATTAIFSNQSTTTAPTYLNNNYFGAPSFYDTVIALNKFDVSGNYTTLDPGFANAATGNFKMSNQTLVGKSIGDPRWR